MPRAKAVNLRPLEQLEQIIANEIGDSGPVSFARFMELALYHPQYGYYTSEKEKLGFGGDFVTSCTLTPVFGHTLAAQLHEMWTLSGWKDFTIVEYGAGTGDLCKSILQYFDRIGHLPGKLRYVIIEISPSLKNIQQAELPSSVEWADHPSAIAGFSGAVISNELLDNFPVHKVTMEDRLMEVRVDYAGGFKEVKVPAAKELVDYFDQLRVKLPRGYITEAGLSVRPWLEEIGSAMEKGFILTIDYGYLAGELYSQRFAEGTLVSYNRHRVVQDVYTNVGEQDITSHVSFSALALYGHNNGLGLTGFRDQAGFLSALGFEKRLKESRDAASAAAMRAEDTILQTLLGDMGHKFKVLCMQKAVPAIQLAGFSGNR